MRKLLLLALLSAWSLDAANFGFVQITPNSPSGGLSQAFPSNNTAGNIIVVIVWQWPNGITVPPVSDSQGNAYSHIVNEAGFLDMWVAFHIAAGANTVTVGGGGGLAAIEISSVNSTYYGCVAGTTSGAINNTSPPFSSASEVMLVWGAYNNTIGTWTAASGTVQFSGSFPFDFGSGGGAGTDDVASVSGTYSNSILVSGSATGTRIGVFLNLDNPTCARAGVFTFPIIY